MFKQIFSALILALAAFLAYVYILPSEYTISREIVIHQSPYVIFPFINNSEKSQEWMPWKEIDPGVEMVYTGPSEGVESKAAWNSSGPMGTGEAVVIESYPPSKVRTQLTYTKPMQMTQTAEIHLESSQASGETKVKWSVTGNNDFMGRVMHIIFNMEGHVGGQFEKGLAKLKQITEEIR